MGHSREAYRAKLTQVDLSDGVSQEEAVIMAQNNLIDDGTDKFCILSRPSVKESHFTVDGDGRPLAPCWEVTFPTTWGVRLRQGLFWGEVLIDKRTGQIKGRGAGPDV